MSIYIYDGSFEGLLTAIYESYYQREIPQNITVQGNLQETLFDSYISIDTDLEKAGKVYQSIKEKISYFALKNTYHCFLSDIEGIELKIYHYLRLGWKMGQDLDLHLSDDRVRHIHNTQRKVAFESHRMMGLLRFKQLEKDIYYAAFEPDHNIVMLLAPHFAERLSDQNWVIHDIKRGLAAIYNKKQWIMTPINHDLTIDVSENEIAYQTLWKQYYKSIAIRSKVNPKLQKRCMPVRYWHHLIEKEI